MCELLGVTAVSVVLFTNRVTYFMSCGGGNLAEKAYIFHILPKVAFLTDSKKYICFNRSLILLTDSLKLLTCSKSGRVYKVRMVVLYRRWR